VKKVLAVAGALGLAALSACYVEEPRPYRTAGPAVAGQPGPTGGAARRLVCPAFRARAYRCLHRCRASWVAVLGHVLWGALPIRRPPGLPAQRHVLRGPLLGCCGSTGPACKHMLGRTLPPGMYLWSRVHIHLLRRRLSPVVRSGGGLSRDVHGRSLLSNVKGGSASTGSRGRGSRPSGDWRPLYATSRRELLALQPAPTWQATWRSHGSASSALCFLEKFHKNHDMAPPLAS